MAITQYFLYCKTIDILHRKRDVPVYTVLRCGGCVPTDDDDGETRLPQRDQIHEQLRGWGACAAVQQQGIACFDQ